MGPWPGNTHTGERYVSDYGEMPYVSSVQSRVSVS
jgi:hypothetical protein